MSIVLRDLKFKITVLKNAPDYAKNVANEVAEGTNSEVIQVIGNKITLFRKRKEKSKFENL